MRNVILSFSLCSQRSAIHTEVLMLMDDGLISMNVYFVHNSEYCERSCYLNPTTWCSSLSSSYGQLSIYTKNSIKWSKRQISWTVLTNIGTLPNKAGLEKRQKFLLTKGRNPALVHIQLSRKEKEITSLL